MFQSIVICTVPILFYTFHVLITCLIKNGLFNRWTCLFANWPIKTKLCIFAKMNKFSFYTNLLSIVIQINLGFNFGINISNKEDFNQRLKKLLFFFFLYIIATWWISHRININNPIAKTVSFQFDHSWTSRISQAPSFVGVLHLFY